MPVGFCSVEVEGVAPSKVHSHEETIPSEVSVKLHNDVAHAIITMQIRMYDESQNMPIYSAEIRESAERLSDLISWAADDLNSKRVVRPEDHISRTSRISDYQ